MKCTRKIYLFFLFFMFSIGIGAKTLGEGGVSQSENEKLQWQEGAHDYFVMFKSLVERNSDANDTGDDNPQADTCIDASTGSTYELVEKYLPSDAFVERAFLVWMAVTDPRDFDNPTDNSVTLSFTHDSGSYTHEEVVTSSITGYLEQSNNFAYEGIKTDYGSYEGAFTYRVDVTSFFEKIHEKGRENNLENTRAEILGSYNVKNLDCTEAQTYQDSSGMAAGWALIMVYQSTTVAPKKIYIYDGLAAYRDTSQDLNVSGFELPPEADVRITLFTAEGDPGLYSPTFTGKEGLMLSGAANPNWTPLFNDCNPDMNGYTEVYNSISSVYPVGAAEPECIGGTPPDFDLNTMEFAMDVDTFLFNASDYPFNEHLLQGDTNLWLKIGANQDQVYTNFMILSVDTRPPDFDIPGEDEKVSCGCGKTPDVFCEGKEFYYAIKIQNWGEDNAYNVTLRDELPDKLKYVAGSAEKSIDNGESWESIPDGGGGAFPFVNPVKIIDFMEYCNKQNKTCPQTAWVRFKVIPSTGLSKKDVVKNTAYISADGGGVYATNLGIPHRLKIGECRADCIAPDLALCGGDKTCEQDSDCNEGYRCQDGTCIKETGNLTTNAQIEFGPGEETPDPQNAHSVLLNNESIAKDVVVGQFYLEGKNGGTPGALFNFDEISIKFETGDTYISLSNVSLYTDEDKNGVVDGADRKIGTVTSVQNSYAKISINPSDRLFDSTNKNYFLITVDASYPESMKIVGTDTYFKAIIEGANAIQVSDAGTASVVGESLEFARFYFEPTAGFLISINGDHSTTIPPSRLNGTRNLMFIRTKSIDQTVSIKSMTASIGSSQYAKFGAGIKSVSLWIDNENDGIPDIELSKPDIDEERNYVEIGNLEQHLQYTPGKEIFLVLKATLDLQQGESAQIVIERNRIAFNPAMSQLTAEDLKTQVYTYDCDGDECSDADDSACQCTVVSAGGNSSSSPFPYLFLLGSALLLYFLRRTAFHKRILMVEEEDV